MYSYDIVEAMSFQESAPKIFKKFPKFYGGLWSKPDSKSFEIQQFYEGCSNFYKVKTYERIELF